MRALTFVEAKEYRQRLSNWMSVAAFGSIVEEIAGLTGFHGVAQRSAQFWREAYVAAACAKATKAQLVRLGADPPDFELKSSGSTLACEITDVIQTGRQRSAEFNAAIHDWTFDIRRPVTDVEMGFELTDVGVALRGAVQRKTLKTYPKGYILVLNVAHMLFRSDIWEMRHELVLIAREGTCYFGQVWVLFSSTLLTVTQDGWSMMEVDKKVGPGEPGA